MANNCLVTKLKSAVQNDSLVKLGELPITITGNSDSFRFFNIKPSKALDLYLTGGAYFTDRNGSGNDGTEKTIQPSSSDESFTFQFGVHGNGVLHIKDKYSLIVLRTGSGDIGFDLDLLGYSYELKEISTINSGTVIGSVGSMNVLSSLKTLSLQSSNITGTFADIKDLALENFGSSTIEGSMADMTGSKSTLKAISIKNFNLMADSTFDFTALKEIIARTINGDLSLLSPNLGYILASGSVSSVSWSTGRTSPKTRFDMLSSGTGVGFNFGEQVDNVLNDFASCVNPDYTGLTKKIIIRGTRTSASDAAVTILKADGWTINLNGSNL